MDSKLFNFSLHPPPSLSLINPLPFKIFVSNFGAKRLFQFEIWRTLTSFLPQSHPSLTFSPLFTPPSWTPHSSLSNCLRANCLYVSSMLDLQTYNILVKINLDSMPRESYILIKINVLTSVFWLRLISIQCPDFCILVKIDLNTMSWRILVKIDLNIMPWLLYSSQDWSSPEKNTELLVQWKQISPFWKKNTIFKTLFLTLYLFEFI